MLLAGLPYAPYAADFVFKVDVALGGLHGSNMMHVQGTIVVDVQHGAWMEEGGTELAVGALDEWHVAFEEMESWWRELI